MSPLPLGEGHSAGLLPNSWLIIITSGTIKVSTTNSSTALSDASLAEFGAAGDSVACSIITNERRDRSDLIRVGGRSDITGCEILETRRRLACALRVAEIEVSKVAM